MSLPYQEPETPPQPDESAPQSEPERNISRLSVIGIGASAGGLRPLQSFLGALPTDTGMVFVVVLHLSPEHESILAELLQPYTAMPVQQVMGRIEMQPDHVYVIPPGKRLLVSGDSLDLADLELVRGRRLQIDAFFQSLARHQGDGAAIILSGAGSDGAVGIQSIKEKGGLILAQSPEEAEYDGMPRSAIATGLVDIVATAPELAVQMVAAKRTQTSLQIPADGAALSETARQTMQQILAHLRVRTGHDFSGYKPGTLLRRISRRMQLAGVETLSAYLHRLRQDHDEVTTLYRDLLIHVTEFFRDPESWEKLAQLVIPRLFANKGRDDIVRAWTVGCATGEEVYSLAILLLEHAATLPQPPRIQVFASDLGKVALDFAREGVYPEAIAATVSEERLERFFIKDNSHYRVRPEVREYILFTPHNLLQDPPFSKLDLISCRNLLIYLQRDIQARVFEIFHYALLTEGYLFLGSAESVDGVDELFETVHKRSRLYQRSQQSRDTLILPTLALAASPPYRSQPERVGRLESRTAGEEHRALLEAMAPPSLLVDEHYHVLHLSETVGRYLQPPGGSLTSDVLKLVRPELQSELRSALFHVLNTHSSTVFTRPVPVRFNGAPHPVSMLVRASLTGEEYRRALVFFLEDESAIAEDLSAQSAHQEGEQTALVTQLEVELHHAQARLQSMNEEYETTVEELRAANEELQSTNEEYRSTLEELETSKEELQSINEELQTVNQELQHKVDQVSQAHGDLQNLLVATEIATLFLDPELCIKRYTPRAAQLFNLMPTDRGRPLSHLRSNLKYERLEDDARQVLDTLAPIEREVQNAAGCWFLMNVRPYRTVENRIDGVVITFVDVTANKETEFALRDAKAYAESIVHTIPDSLLVLQTDLRVKTANDTFYQTFGAHPAETEGRLIYELGNGQWDIPELRTLLEEILPTNKVFIGYEVDHVFETIGRRTMLLNGRQLDHAQLILLAITDITGRKQAEESLREAQESLEVALDAAQMGSWHLDLITNQAHTSLRYNQIFGYSEPAPEWNLEQFQHHILPEERPKFQAAYARALETGELDIEVPIRRRDGGICWIHDVGRVLYNEEKTPVRMAGVTVDVTERKEAATAEMRQRILHAQEMERTHLAHELHDGPVQELAALTFELAALMAQMSDEFMQTALAAVTAKIERNIRLLRHIMVTLRPPAVVSFGLVTAIEHYVADIRQQQPHLAIELALAEEISTLPEEIILGLYRICQQAIYNVIQHAEATQVWVRLYPQNKHLILEVKDNGIGFTMPDQLVDLPRRKHLGIVGMSERAQAIGGDLIVRSAPDEGTQVRVTVPLS